MTIWDAYLIFIGKTDKNANKLLKECETSINF